MAKQGTAGDGAEACPDAVKRLIDRFDQQSDHIRSPDYGETLVRVDFIDPLMKELGWDINNVAGLPQNTREVVHEARVKVGGQTKAPDYSFGIAGTVKFYLEAKNPPSTSRKTGSPRTSSGVTRGRKSFSSAC